MKQLQLIDILRLMDPLANLVIWTSDFEDEPEFVGHAFEVPWGITEYYLTPFLDDGESAISVRKDEGGNSIMVVSVSKEEKQCEKS